MEAVRTTAGDGDWRETASDGSMCVVRVGIAELNIQKVLQARLDDLVWNLKLKLLSTIAKDLKDGLNYGLYCPPQGGKAGKFLEEERPLIDYPFAEPIGYLEFKYKRRVYKLLQVNPKKLKQLHTKANLKQFMSAVQSSDIGKINKLSLKGIDPNFHDRELNETPLTYACATRKSREVILALIAAGAHIDFRNKDGYTAMHRAAALGNHETIKTLLELGASPNYRDANGLTPLYLSVCAVTPATCTELLLHDRAVLEVRDSAGWTEVHQACKAGRVQHLEHLLFYGADMNAQHSAGNTPLHVCALHNQESCARVLLFRGADRTLQNYSSQTAFQVAVISGNFDLAEIIRTFSDNDIVPFQEMPQYNNKRRSLVPVLGQLQRCRSNPNLTLLMSEESKPPSPALSNNSLPQYGLSSTPHTNRHTTPRGSLSTGSGSSLQGRPKSYIEESSDFLLSSGPRTVVLQRGSAGFGFILRGLKCKQDLQPTGFSPTADFPSLQCLQQVDAGGVAEKAGLRAGDFILEVNGVDVSKSSHDVAVNIIRQSGDTVMMKVVTVTAEITHDDSLFMYPSGATTLPLKRAPDSKSNGLSSTASSGSHAKSKYSSGLKEEPIAQINTMLIDRSVPGRNWLDRPMTGFGRMRAAISCSDLSRGSAGHMSAYVDNDDDEDMLAYLALNDKHGGGEGRRLQQKAEQAEIVHEQTGKRIAVNVVKESPASLRMDRNANLRGRDSSTNSESSYQADWLSNYSEHRTETIHLDSSVNGENMSGFSGLTSGDDNFDVDSLIVPCPPSFSSTLPSVDIPFVLPPPPITDDLEGEVVPISLKEYSSGSESLRSRNGRSSTRSNERISTFFAPTDIDLLDDKLHSEKSNANAAFSLPVVPPPPPPPVDIPAAPGSFADDHHSRYSTYSNSKKDDLYSLHSSLSPGTSTVSLAKSVDVSASSRRPKQSVSADQRSTTSSLVDVDPSHAALLAAIAKRRQLMENAFSNDALPATEAGHWNGQQKNGQDAYRNEIIPASSEMKPTSYMEYTSGKHANGKSPNFSKVMSTSKSPSLTKSGITTTTTSATSTTASSASNKLVPGMQSNGGAPVKGLFALRSAPSIPLSHVSSQKSDSSEETQKYEDVDFLLLAEKARLEWLHQQKVSPMSTLARQSKGSVATTSSDQPVTRGETVNTKYAQNSELKTSSKAIVATSHGASVNGVIHGHFERRVENSDFLPPPPDSLFLASNNDQRHPGSINTQADHLATDKALAKGIEVASNLSAASKIGEPVRKQHGQNQNLVSSTTSQKQEKPAESLSSAIASAKAMLRSSANSAVILNEGSSGKEQLTHMSELGNGPIVESGKKSNSASAASSQSLSDFRQHENFATLIANQAAHKQKKLDVIVDGKGSIRKSHLTGQRVVYSSASRFGQVIQSESSEATKTRSSGNFAQPLNAKADSGKDSSLTQHKLGNGVVYKQVKAPGNGSADLPPPPEFDFDFDAPGRVFIEDSSDTFL